MSETQEPQPEASSGAKPKSKRNLLIAVFAIVFVLALIAGFLSNSSKDDDAGPKTGANGELIYKVTLGEMWVKPSSISVPSGSRVVLDVKNVGEMDHDLKLNGKVGTPMLAPGESNKADIGVITSKSQAWCTVPEHKAAGMFMDIEVK